MTDAAGCSLRWNESTHYVRAIAVFKISLTLCVSICRAFGQIGKGKPRGRREDWLVVIYKRCTLWLPFPRLKHKKKLVTHSFFSFPHLVWGFLTCTHTGTHIQNRSALPFLSLSLSHNLGNAHTHTDTHTPNACIHTPRLSLATELPLQWDHHFKNKAVGCRSQILTIRNF